MREERILVRSFGRQQLVANDTLDVFEAAAFARDAARNALRQVRVAASPCEDAVHQGLRQLAVAAKRDGQSIALLWREVARREAFRVRHA